MPRHPVSPWTPHVTKGAYFWEVPDYEVTRWMGRTKDYCVIIPVINEGDRIGSLLRKIKCLEIASIADVIVVDGGSTDGSLAQELLDETAVSGLITKLGPGKLSAQLRCAYAFALAQGYSGLVTIDGNDKDEPYPIPEFIGHLRRGVDFVQASRYIPGGVAVNTPKARDLAIRLVHAPLISLGSGYRWTDTTQGFRGYRREFLEDSRVAPFRDVFVAYELLAYLSWRAPRLGFSCLEIPSTRRYPDGEVPTKIPGIRGNLQLVKVLLKTVLGRYSPKDMREAASSPWLKVKRWGSCVFGRNPHR